MPFPHLGGALWIKQWCFIAKPKSHIEVIMEKQIDQNITKQDLEYMEDALSQLEIAWHNLMNTNCRMSGDCNEIIENKYPFCSSFDDFYHNDIKEWLKSCRKNIQKYRKIIYQHKIFLFKIHLIQYSKNPFPKLWIQGRITRPETLFCGKS